MIDTQAIKQNIRITSLLPDTLKKRGQWHVGSCPLCGGTDRFSVKAGDNGDLWHCRHCSPTYGDVISLHQKLHNFNFRESCKALGGAIDDLPAPAIAKPSAPPKPETNIPSDDWRYYAETAVIDCANILLAGYDDPITVGGGASLWLQKRGIDKRTAQRFMLGYNPDWRDVPHAGKLMPGITIPCFAGDNIDLWYVKVRVSVRLKSKDKYMFLKGSSVKALFNANSLDTADTVYITEGEFDAMLLSNYLPEGQTAVTIGGSTMLPTDDWRAYFAPLRGAYLAMDNDTAGQDAVKRWEKWLQWAKIAPPIQSGKDLTDMWQAGHDLGQWAGGVS